MKYRQIFHCGRFIPRGLGWIQKVQSHDLANPEIDPGKRHKLFRYAKFKKAKLGGGNSNMFYFHPEPWGSEPVWLIFLKGVETTK